MHAVLITFTSSVTLDQLATPFAEYAEALRSVPGLVMKTWIADGSTLSGFHIFIDASTADTYLNGELCRSILNNPTFTSFDVRHFETIDSLSAVTGSPDRHAALNN
jgi:Putative mono-oxygenase ydhR